jgi:hypothetical protein
MKRIAITLWMFLILPFLAFAQRNTDVTAEGASAALKQLIEFSNRQALRSEPARKLLVAETAKWDMPSFGKLADAPDKMVMLDKEAAVGRVQWFGENDQVTDLYFYLRFDGSWKISAMRRLALPGIMEQLYFGLNAKKSRTQEEQDMFDNIGLVLASDKTLREWFQQNHESLNKLYKLTQKKDGSKSLYINDSNKRFPEIAQALKRLHLSVVEVQENGNVEIVIGGMTDNTVGFVYSPSKSPPPISPSEYIWVEEIAENWYLFRTT